MLREEQMDMLMMMEQMEKLQQEFCPGSFSDCSSEFSSYVGYNLNGGSTGDLHAGYGAVAAPVMGSAGHVNSEPAMISQVLAGASSSSSSGSNNDHKASSVAAMREMIFRIAAMQPINIDPESVKPPKRRNVKISTDPQSVAARHRRERISERIRILQRLVPGGTKMDTASMLDEAIHYVKFLKTQVQSLERAAADRSNPGIGVPGAGGYLSVGRNYQTGGNQMMFPPSTQLYS